MTRSWSRFLEMGECMYPTLWPGAECDTRLIFKWSITGLNLVKIKEPSLPWYLLIADREGDNSWIHTLFLGYYCYVKGKRPLHLGYELELPSQFPTKITIMPWVQWENVWIHVLFKNVNMNWLYPDLSHLLILFSAKLTIILTHTVIIIDQLIILSSII